jgi:hypothetical protein
MNFMFRLAVPSAYFWAVLCLRGFLQATSVLIFCAIQTFHCMRAAVGFVHVLLFVHAKNA